MNSQQITYCNDTIDVLSAGIKAINLRIRNLEQKGDKRAHYGDEIEALRNVAQKIQGFINSISTDNQLKTDISVETVANGFDEITSAINMAKQEIQQARQGMNVSQTGFRNFIKRAASIFPQSEGTSEMTMGHISSYLKDTKILLQEAEKQAAASPRAPRS